MPTRSKYARALSATTFAAVLAANDGRRFDRPAPLLTEREKLLAEAVLVHGIGPYEVADTERASLSTIYAACRRVLARARMSRGEISFAPTPTP